MALPIYRYPLDPTGLNPDNFVLNENHSLTPKADLTHVRVLSPKCGPFFKVSITIKDAADNRLLVAGVDYISTELLQDPTLKFGKEICQFVVITNGAVSNNVIIGYQTLGGNYQNDATAVQNVFETFLNDDRDIDWTNISGRPPTFRPSEHVHLLEDVIGFGPMIVAVERVREAILLSNAPMLEALIDWIISTRAPIEHVGSSGVDQHAVATPSVAGFMDSIDKAKLDTIEEGSTKAPIGSVIQCAANDVPLGYLRADGSPISRAVYWKLFGSIGTSYGDGDGYTTFNIPDLRGVFTRGWDDGRGIDPDRTVGSYQTDALGKHTHQGATEGTGEHSHPLYDPGHTHNYLRAGGTAPQSGNSTWCMYSPYMAPTDPSYTGITIGAGGGHNHTVAMNLTGGPETRPINMALPYFIKY